MKKIIKIILDKLGYSIIRKDIRKDFVSWAKDSDFENSFLKVKSYTMLDRDRLFMLWQFVKQSNNLNGSLAQVGVFRGGSARLIEYAKGGLDKKFYLFDTFEGMPKVNEKIDLHKEGDFQNTSLDGVKKIFSDSKNVIFCKGIFPATSDIASSEKFSFVYVDVDIYQSTIDSLNFFYPRMVSGGFIMFDDYMGKNTPGVKKALEEFLVDKKEIPIITTIGQCVVIKQ